MSARKETAQFPGIDALRRRSGRIAIIGDTQRTSRLEFWWRANDQAQSALLAALADSTPDVVINVGDVVTWGNSRAQWRHFERTHAPIRDAQIPYLAVLGNHDLMPWTPRKLAPFRARFPVLRAARWYAFSHVGVGFIGLDSNFSKLPRSARAAQDGWLVEALARFEADQDIRHIIAFWHHSPFTNSRVVLPSAEAQRRFLPPLLATTKLRAVFTGHCHAYEHFIEQDRHFFVTGGGGGPLQPLRTSPRRRRFEDQFSWPGRHRFLHYCELTPADDAITVRVMKLDEDGVAAAVDTVTCR